MPDSTEILVAGDVCLDVVVVPIPPPSSANDPNQENWRLTGEKRTHFLPGGAILLSEFVKEAVVAAAKRNAVEQQKAVNEKNKIDGDAADYEVKKASKDAEERCRTTISERVRGPSPVKPAELCQLPVTASGKVAKPVPEQTLTTEEFVALAERLKRDEVVHSLLEAAEFSKTSNPKEKDKVVRLAKEYGFSGPATNAAPTLQIRYLNCEVAPRILVLADTGNRFRKKTDDVIPWPAFIEKPEQMTHSLVVYKLHHPLPTNDLEQPPSGGISKSTPPTKVCNPNKLWTQIKTSCGTRRLTVVSVEDLRSAGAPISRGLSWERTALDVVWQLLNVPQFAELRDCPYLVIRLGLDGAILWTFDKGSAQHRAWLIYDPLGIEDAYSRTVPGRMVAFSSAFTATLVERLHSLPSDDFQRVLAGPVNRKPNDPDPPAADPDKPSPKPAVDLLREMIPHGLQAARKLLELGYSSIESKKNPHYPGAKMFLSPAKESDFAVHEIPIIPLTLVPDRGYWRLLDAQFENKLSTLFTAVELVATNRMEVKEDKRATPGEKVAKKLLAQVPVAKFGKLTTYDRREIEYYRSLHTLLSDYLATSSPPRPLSVAVFGPPGAGKSFGVKQVVESLKDVPGCKPVVDHTFNLSLYQSPDELAAAFHLVRDEALRGKVPLVFFDEFDTSLAQRPLGWLRYFLAPMQDGNFLDRGAPHPIGQAIFIFAGGTSSTYEEFMCHPGLTDTEFKTLKGPDFLSRLRAKLDIPSLNFAIAYRPSPPGKRAGSTAAPPSVLSDAIETFDPYQPVELFPNDAAVRLRRANVLSFNLTKMTGLTRADKSLSIDPAVLRTMLGLPRFEHGNRSLEALIDMSHLLDATKYTPSQMPADCQCPLHANIEQINQLIGVEFPFPDTEQMLIAEEIHKHYLQQRLNDEDFDETRTSYKEWKDLTDDDKQANMEQALDIPNKLWLVGLWFRKINKPIDRPANTVKLLPHQIELLAHREHDRWVASKRRKGYVYGNEFSKELRTHPCIVPWDKLPNTERQKDRDTIRAIPRFLKKAGYIIVKSE